MDGRFPFYDPKHRESSVMRYYPSALPDRRLHTRMVVLTEVGCTAALTLRGTVTNSLRSDVRS